MSALRNYFVSITVPELNVAETLLFFNPKTTREKIAQGQRAMLGRSGEA